MIVGMEFIWLRTRTSCWRYEQCSELLGSI